MGKGTRVSQAQESKLIMFTIGIPDPWNTGMFTYYEWEEVIEYSRSPKKTICEWCKSTYNDQKENCPNCGAPQSERNDG